MFEANFLSLPERLDQHAHAHWQLVIPLEGTAEFGIGQQHFDVCLGRALVLAADETHAFLGKPANQLMLINLGVQHTLDSWDTHLEPISSLFGRTQCLALSHSVQQWLRLTALEMRKFIQPPVVYSQSILMSLAREANRAALTTIEVRHIQLVVDYIQAHLGEPLRVSELAQLLQLSSSQFHKKFRDKTGFSPHQYILQARLERAKCLIQSSRQSLSDIAFDVGFSSQSALTNAMRRYWGVTPSMLRSDASP